MGNTTNNLPRATNKLPRMGTKAYAKLIRRLERNLAASYEAEENARDLKTAWRLASITDTQLRRLNYAKAGIVEPMPVTPRTAKNVAKGGFAALAMIGRAIALAHKIESGLRLTRLMSRAARASVRHSSTSVLATFAWNSGRTFVVHTAA